MDISNRILMQATHREIVKYCLEETEDDPVVIWVNPKTGTKLIQSKKSEIIKAAIPLQLYVASRCTVATKNNISSINISRSEREREKECWRELSRPPIYSKEIFFQLFPPSFFFTNFLISSGPLIR